MRIRTIKPEFWSHPIMGRLDDFTKLLAIGLLNMADDEGLFVADVSIIKSSLMPFTEDSVRIHGALTDLSRHGWIEIRRHPERGSLGMVVNFKKHQVINRPTASKIRTYWDSLRTHGGLTEDSVLEQGTGNREQGTGKVGAIEQPPELDIAAADLVGPLFPIQGGVHWRCPKGLVETMENTYPGMDVEGELAKAALWLNASPSRRKTARGMQKFLAGWLSRVGQSPSWAKPTQGPVEGSEEYYRQQARRICAEESAKRTGNDA
jgi:hypothetical protein